MASKQSQQIRDEIGSEPSITTIPKIKFEHIIVPPASYQSTLQTIGESWIVGSSTNGIVGNNTNTQSGNQQVVGGSGRVTLRTRIVNDKNTYFEEFNYSNFKDSSETGGVWDGTGSVEVGTANPLQSLSVWKDVGTCVAATMIITISSGTSNVQPYMTADGTATAFESVSDGAEHTFTNPGGDLRWRIEAQGTANISRVKIIYKLKQ